MNTQSLKQLEDDLWRSADTLRANSDLKSSEYSTPVLGLIFLKFADNKYRRNEKAIMAQYTKLRGTRREKPVSEIAIEKCGFYLPDHARYDHLLKLPEEQDIAKAIRKAMEAIEEDAKTEEEFIQELLAMDQELNDLNKEARALEKIIHHNVLKLTGEE